MIWFSRTQLVPGLIPNFCRGCRVAFAVRPLTVLWENWKSWESWAATDLGLSQSRPGFLSSPEGDQALVRLSAFRFSRQVAFETAVQVGTLVVSTLSAEQLQLRDVWEGAGKLQKCWCPHTIWWTRTHEAELVRLCSHKSSQVSR